MVKVIKRGTPAMDRTYVETCKNCGTKFEFKRFESRFVSDNRDGAALVIACPACDQAVWHAA